MIQLRWINLTGLSYFKFRGTRHVAFRSRKCLKRVFWVGTEASGLWETVWRADLLSICNGGDSWDDHDERRSVRRHATRSARRRWQLTSRRPEHQHQQQQQQQRRATDRRSEHARPGVDRGLMETSRPALIVQRSVSTFVRHFGDSSSQWVSSFLTAHQHIKGHFMPSRLLWK